MKITTPFLCEQLCKVDLGDVPGWITDIPIEAWQFLEREKGKIRRGRVTTSQWNDFYFVTDPIVKQIVPIEHTHSRQLSCLMPGCSILAHRDSQQAGWIRVQVPLATNEKSWTWFLGRYVYHMAVGDTYLMDITQEHEVINEGLTPRIHLMFDAEEQYLVA